MQAIRSGFLVEITKPLGWATALISTDADANHVAVKPFGRQGKDFGGGFRAEVAHCIEDPEQRDAEIALAALASSLQTIKDGSEILPAPANHSNADINFRVHHILLAQLLHQAIGDQLVVVGRAQ